MGQWLEINGEAIYDTSPWFHQKDSLNPDVWYTCTKKVYNQLQPLEIPLNSDAIKAVYVIFLKWPSDNILKIKDAEPLLTGKYYKTQFLNYDGYASVNVSMFFYAKALFSLTIFDKATESTGYAIVDDNTTSFLSTCFHQPMNQIFLI